MLKVKRNYLMIIMFYSLIYLYIINLTNLKDWCTGVNSHCVHTSENNLFNKKFMFDYSLV